jgi:cell shape-determining protein MreC
MGVEVLEQLVRLIEENERLRAELGPLEELRAIIERVNQDNNRLRNERDELLAAFHRMAHLV